MGVTPTRQAGKMNIPFGNGVDAWDSVRAGFPKSDNREKSEYVCL